MSETPAAPTGSASSVPDVLNRIVRRRKQRIAEEGPGQGLSIPVGPSRRTRRLLADGPVIAEIKRRSPSAGVIADLPDPVAQAARYHHAGVRAFSILTEQDHFGGSLADLLEVRKAFPEVAILRKDFLLSRQDIRVSAAFGADAVLLIAAILDDSQLQALHEEAESLGLEALVEVHTEAEVARVARLKPALLGCNARDLRDFSVDLLRPLSLRPGLTWPAELVFESGIRSEAAAQMAAQAGFSGILVGEAAVRDPDLPRHLEKAFTGGRSNPAGFWTEIARRLHHLRPGLPALPPDGLPLRPLIKICGITDKDDARRAIDLGADLLGFVFADSPRRASAQLLHSLGDIDTPRIAVVDGRQDIPADIADLAAEGLVDALQLHGGVPPQPPVDARGRRIPWYPAARISGASDLAAAGASGSPRVLLDAYSDRAAGGTGERISADILAQRSTALPLWLAGGLSPDNIAGIVRELRPELVDASSRLEASPGRKDYVLLERYFTEIRRATS